MSNKKTLYLWLDKKKEEYIENIPDSSKRNIVRSRIYNADLEVGCIIPAEEIARIEPKAYLKYRMSGVADDLMDLLKKVRLATGYIIQFQQRPHSDYIYIYTNLFDPKDILPAEGAIWYIGNWKNQVHNAFIDIKVYGLECHMKYAEPGINP